MPEPVHIPPRRRLDLVISAPQEDGFQVVKDRYTGGFFQLGPEEMFLFSQLDGQQSVLEICAAFENRFGQPLAPEEFNEFVALVAAEGFLQSDAANGSAGAVASGATASGPVSTGPVASGPVASVPAPAAAASGGVTAAGIPVAASGNAVAATVRRAAWSVQSLLYWRKRLFDPDRLLSWMAVWLWPLYTISFLVVSLTGMLAALVVAVSNRNELVETFVASLGWETFVIAWLALVVATMCHEFAHGLTCKHFGGEVHEIGFLLLFGIPCFYCNVSDTWLFRERYKRLWVTLAGGYCDLCVWALAVFVWRFTQPGTSINHVSAVVLTVCGGRVFFNFNPFLKLDGYYLLSDWLKIHNLQQRSHERLMANVRRVLWGGPAPEPEARPWTLVLYGAGSWLIMLSYAATMLAAVVYVGRSGTGWTEKLVPAFLCFLIARSLFEGTSKGEIGKMIILRHARLAVWILLLSGLAWALTCVELDDRRGGTFQVRTGLRAELRARAPGFLRSTYVDEGDQVSAGATIAHLDVPDLESRVLQKKAELREAGAKLSLLELGPRPEEVREQRDRVRRGEAWCEQARADLALARVALKHDLARLDRQIALRKSELEYATQAFRRDERLLAQEVLPRDQYLEKKKNFEVAQAMLSQAGAERNARAARGTLEAEAELGRRDKELADARAALVLLQLGTRPQEIEAERARRDRLGEELRGLEALSERLPIRSPVRGVVTTPRLKEKIGQFLKEGDLICSVDQTSPVEVEVTLDEQDVAQVTEGSLLYLKARAFSTRMFTGEVIRVAPALRKEPTGDASRPTPRADAPGTITVYAVVLDGEDLRPGMTGYARISCGKRSLAALVFRQALQFVRPEYWW